MTSITVSYDVEERRNGWRFRFPAGDEGALWFGPFTTREEAEGKALKAIEEYVAKQVAANFGLKY